MGYTGALDTVLRQTGAQKYLPEIRPSKLTAEQPCQGEGKRLRSKETSPEEVGEKYMEQQREMTGEE